MHKQYWVQSTYCYGQALQLADGDTIKTMKIIRGSLDAAFELTKVIKCSFFKKIIGKKIKHSSKTEGASSRLRKNNAAGNFGDTILCLNCQRGIATKQDSRVRGQVIGQVKCKCKVSISFLEYNWEFYFWGIQTNYPLLYDTHTFRGVATNSGLGEKRQV